MTALETIGTSREGRPLRMLTVGDGGRHALVVGMPHPNEPVGAVAALRLAGILAKNAALRSSLGLTWHIVPCADPDGAALNAAWFRGPYTRETYATGIYRSPFDEQFEWTFHRADLPDPGLPATPESRAVMTVIDTLRPELLVSLHNGEVGGLYCYATDPSPSLRDGLARTSATTGIPVDHGIPEEPATLLAPGVFHVPANLTGGPMLCSTDYAAQYGTFGVMTEPPLWLDPQADDVSAIAFR